MLFWSKTLKITCLGFWNELSAQKNVNERKKCTERYIWFTKSMQWKKQKMKKVGLKVIFNGLFCEFLRFICGFCSKKYCFLNAFCLMGREEYCVFVIVWFLHCVIYLLCCELLGGVLLVVFLSWFDCFFVFFCNKW